MRMRYPFPRLPLPPSLFIKISRDHDSRFKTIKRIDSKRRYLSLIVPSIFFLGPAFFEESLAISRKLLARLAPYFFFFYYESFEDSDDYLIIRQLRFVAIFFSSSFKRLNLSCHSFYYPSKYFFNKLHLKFYLSLSSNRSYVSILSISLEKLCPRRFFGQTNIYIFRKIDGKSWDISTVSLLFTRRSVPPRVEKLTKRPSTEKLTTLSRFALSDRGPAETEQLMPAGNYN